MASLYSCESVMSGQGSAQELTKSLLDSISLLCDASHKLDVYRRKLFKPEIHSDFSALCAESRPIGLTLFGELSEEVKKCLEAAKLHKKVHTDKAKRYKPYSRPFLGHRGSSHRRGGGSRWNSNNNSSGNNSNNFNKNQFKKKPEWKKKPSQRK